MHAPQLDDNDIVQRLRELHHDIRQPLAAIGALASAASAQPDVPDVVLTCLDRIHTETRELLGLCRHILDECQTDQPVPLDAIASDVVEGFARTTSCRIEVEAVPCTVETSPIEFRRALVNLLDNALRAAGPNGDVIVRVERDEDEITVEVDDSGPGFGAIRSGTYGIGLSIVERYARRHGGSVTVGRSACGGAAVSFALPYPPSRDRNCRAMSNPAL